MQSLEFTLGGISITGTVVDLETASIEPVSGGIFTFGYIAHDKMRILQAENKSECEDLEQHIKTTWDTLPRPTYAYNKEFEEKWLSKATGSDALIDHDLMQMWRATSEDQGLKWPRLRELVRPPVFYYRWGLADLDRETDPAKLRRTIRMARSATEVVSLEARGDTSHEWWQEHLEAIQNPLIQDELTRLSDGETESHSPDVYRLPNGNWTTTKLATIICHNMMDLQSEASLLLWSWNLMGGRVASNRSVTESIRCFR